MPSPTSCTFGPCQWASRIKTGVVLMNSKCVIPQVSMSEYGSGMPNVVTTFDICNSWSQLTEKCVTVLIRTIPVEARLVRKVH